MSNPEFDIELIESYLMDSSTPQESTLVEERLLSDPEFTTLFNEIKILVGGIQATSRKEILQQLQEEETQIKKSEIDTSSNVISINKQQTTRKLWQPLSIAAGILLLVGVVYFTNPFGSNSNKQLASFYEPLPPELLYNFVRSDQNTADNSKPANAAKALMHNDSNQASTLLHEIIFDDGHLLDTMENTIRIYANILIRSSKKDCSKNNQSMEELKAATKTTPWYGTVLIDQILLAKKCSLDGVDENKAAINSLSLSEYDRERWDEIKELL